uniref:Acetyl-coenzyme A carboxylase carboxyl transferase subunit alpha n=1 Tax=Choreocolax polysiphoniae TaxID=282351 RepID=A0A0B5VUI0_9FLOR|nr:acetyl-coenzyme A carboxylase carboxyl transferase subunit alpha [Choreocolax polysiphoniae]AJH65838.1 acetyl-coenzyme A carboxylase carboxyl transferase subunit alpha [Choreocolax polysiphoniae]
MLLKKNLILNFLKPIVEFEYKLKQLNTILMFYKNINLLHFLKKDIKQLKTNLYELRNKIFQSITPLQRLDLVRQSNRPTTLDYISKIINNGIELYGDRGGNNDLAMVGGIGYFNLIPVLFIGHQRGKNTKDNVIRNFGMASPGGYRKALRLMKHANQFNFPILTFIDTPGAWAGIEAEKLGQGEAIALNLREMFSLEVPIICTIIGEGGSGGALGIGIGDKILMLEYSIYTIATPEACAAILWKDSTKSPAAAESLKITSSDLKLIGIIDDIIKEPIGGSQFDPYRASIYLKNQLSLNLNILISFSRKKRKKLRYIKFRKLGTFYE